MSNIIFLIGEAGSGKDTVAKLLAEDGYKRIAFADKLKQEYYSDLGITYCAEEEDRDFKEKHRQGLIDYGEAKRISKGLSYWINKAFDDYWDEGLFVLKDSTPNLVVTDVRRCREVEFVLSMKLFSNANVFFYHVDRLVYDNDELTMKALRESAKTKGLLDGVIDNNGTLKQLKEDVRQISRKIERESRRHSEGGTNRQITIHDVLGELGL